MERIDWKRSLREAAGRHASRRGAFSAGLTALAVAAVSGGLLAICDSLTAQPPDKRRNAQHENLL